MSIWNTLTTVRTGRVKLLDSGRELFGTVVKHGINDKTVTVRVSSRGFNERYKRPVYNHKNKQVHDEYNYCVAGDKVIIHTCEKLSKSKAYYVKKIVVPFGRSMSDKDKEYIGLSPSDRE